MTSNFEKNYFAFKRPNRNSKIRALSDNAEEMIAIKHNVSSPVLQQLPMVFLSQIASNLNIREQKHFADTCKIARLVRGQSI